MFKIALVGAWHVHFKGYASTLIENENCKITCIWDTDEKRGVNYAKEFSCDFVKNYDELLDRPDVDGVMVCTETNLHHDIIIKAAKKGKHIFTEKVLCFTKKEALEVAEAVKLAKVKFCISFPHLCEAPYICAKNMIKNGDLGQITFARFRKAHNGVSAHWLPNSFYVKEDCGGGAMMDLGAHPMYVLSDLFGEVESVKSMFSCDFGKGVDDNAVSLLKFKDVIAVSETSFVTAHSPITLEVSGAKGTLIWGGTANELLVNTGDGFIAPTLPDALPDPLRQWVNAVVTGSDILSGIDDAVRLSNVMELAYKALGK